MYIVLKSSLLVRTRRSRFAVVALCSCNVCLSVFVWDFFFRTRVFSLRVLPYGVCHVRALGFELLTRTHRRRRRHYHRNGHYICVRIFVFLTSTVRTVETPPPSEYRFLPILRSRFLFFSLTAVVCPSVVLTVFPVVRGPTIFFPLYRFCCFGIVIGP